MPRVADNYEMVKEIVTEEAKELGERGLQKVFLGGLSQGCAMSLHVLLAFDRDEEEKCMGFGGFIGMSGWLPFQDEINSLLGIRRGDDGEEDENPFGDESGDEEDGGDAEDPVVKVARFIRKDVMNLSKAQNELLVCRHTPIFLGHGDQDDVVPLEYGKNVMEALQAMGINLEWKVYAEQGHWYKVPDTIDDIVRFFGEKYAGLNFDTILPKHLHEDISNLSNDCMFDMKRLHNPIYHPFLNSPCLPTRKMKRFDILPILGIKPTEFPIQDRNDLPTTHNDIPRSNVTMRKHRLMLRQSFHHVNNHLCKDAP